MRRLLFFCLFVATFALAYVVTDRGRPRDAYLTVCDLVSKHFYQDTPKLRAWLVRCGEVARHLPARISTADVLRVMQDQMDELGVSHFGVYAPAEDRELWTGRGDHTGIRARFVEGHLLVYEVIAESAADQAGVRAGDELIQLPDVEEVSPFGAANRAGEFVLNRRGKEFRVTLTPTPIVTNGAPLIRELPGGVAHLIIPSFRADYFAPDQLSALTRRLAHAHGLIVDVRENAGGNFAAMLRTLSFLTCGGVTIGHLRQARNVNGTTGTLINSLSDRHQIHQLMGARELALKTPVGYGCYQGPVVTLIGSETSSVAEVFADAMGERPRSLVWGWPTSGDVVLAIWYPLPSLGPDFTVSIPQASFLNSHGRDLEGAGVRPSRELFYDLKSAQRGEDSWVSEAARALR